MQNNKLMFFHKNKLVYISFQHRICDMLNVEPTHTTMISKRMEVYFLQEDQVCLNKQHAQSYLPRFLLNVSITYG